MTPINDAIRLLEGADAAAAREHIELARLAAENLPPTGMATRFAEGWSVWRAARKGGIPFCAPRRQP
jgi:hypothetical protein